MKNRILIDAGIGGQTLCTGERAPADQAPVQKIGKSIKEKLERMGCDALFSGEVEELNCEAREGGRPALCAAIAKAWRADCVLRLCVREGETPVQRSAVATVHKGDRRGRMLAERILHRLDLERELHASEIRTATNVLLLRRTPCPSVILVLKLPFGEMEGFCWKDADLYADCIADGIQAWLQPD